MAGLLCDSRNEKRDVTADWMDKTQDTANLLETVEKDMAEIQEPQAAGNPSQGRVAMANSRLGCWHIARTWILTTSLTNKYLASQGYDDILLRYEAMRARYRTAVYRTVRTVV